MAIGYNAHRACTAHLGGPERALYLASRSRLSRRLCMTRSILRSLLVAGVCAANAAWAGTVYVPLPGVTAVGTATYEAQVSIGNPAVAARNISQVQIADDSDGT